MSALRRYRLRWTTGEVVIEVKHNLELAMPRFPILMSILWILDRTSTTILAVMSATSRSPVARLSMELGLDSLSTAVKRKFTAAKSSGDVVFSETEVDILWTSKSVPVCLTAIAR
jgi:hypothetical protein